MSSHEEKICPRCGVGFECKSGTVLLCQCSTVELSDEHREFIMHRYDDCLCAACLQVLRREYNYRQHTAKIVRIR